VEATAEHQVQRHDDRLVELEQQVLASSIDGGERATFEGGERRVDGAKRKGIDERRRAGALAKERFFQPLADHPQFGQFGHACSVAKNVIGH
jgi:hypothetical protein